MKWLTKDKSQDNVTYWVDSHPQEVYNQDSIHQRPSYKFHMFHPVHPKSMKQQHAIYIWWDKRIRKITNKLQLMNKY
jgi:hypothetical protein